MPVFLSILRGINVSGQKKILMADLKKLYHELKFKNVTTYIQSGNVVFETGSDKNLSKKIEQKILEHYSFEVPVIIRTTAELEKTVANTPFERPEGTYVTFLESVPNQEYVEKIKPYNTKIDTFHVIEKEIYLYCDKGYGNTKLSNNFFENKLKVKATTRNWATTCELLRIMETY